MSTSRHAKSVSLFSALLLGAIFVAHMSNSAPCYARGAQSPVNDDVQLMSSLTRISTYPLQSQELRYLLTDSPSLEDSRRQDIQEQIQQHHEPFENPARLIAGETALPPAYSAESDDGNSCPDQELATVHSGLTFSEILRAKVNNLTQISQMVQYAGVNAIVAMFDSVTSNYYRAQNASPIQAHVHFLKSSPIGIESKLHHLADVREAFQSELGLEFSY